MNFHVSGDLPVPGVLLRGCVPICLRKRAELEEDVLPPSSSGPVLLAVDRLTCCGWSRNFGATTVFFRHRLSVLFVAERSGLGGTCYRLVSFGVGQPSPCWR